ncbi:decarboxylating 6-phosphogluconate dehydrogenase [candidate division KSB1 bacterium]|nr:decarboxylating 6-phosphogluconate dehydrogenase [candidate division KSB1 bacterium]
MVLGFFGLGRMGGNMVERLLRGGHSIIAGNRSPGPVADAVRQGAVGAATLHDVVRNMPGGRKAVWVMLPAGNVTESALVELMDLLKPGDIVIDGGNANYKDSIRRGELLKTKALHFMDAGTSGGIWGLQVGYCLMVGGEPEPFAYLEPALKTLAPENGYLHTGGVGSGHYTKMVHNGIEYGMMQAYGEGFEILKSSPFNLDLARISKLWEQGSVVRSWLLELTTRALEKDPELAAVKAYVADSGEGRWTLQEAIDRDVPAYVIAASLFARFASRHDNAYGLRLISALRNEFGGHAVKKA